MNIVLLGLHLALARSHTGSKPFAEYGLLHISTGDLLRAAVKSKSDPA